MKYLKIIIRRGTGGQPAMVYPSPYLAKEVDANKRGPIQYESAMSLGEATEECMIFLNDAVADVYAAGSVDMEILTEAQTDTWLAANRKLKFRPEERTTDPDRIAVMQLKTSLGQELSAEDLRSLDPDDKTPGITKIRKTAKDIFD